MRTLPIPHFLASMGCDYFANKNRCEELGDVMAFRIEKETKKKVRANYERGLLLSGLANKFGLTDFLEIGTGRGFTTACVAEFCPTIKRIVTVDVEPVQRVIDNFALCSVDATKIKLIQKKSSKLDDTDLIEGTNRLFDLFLIDAAHEGPAVLGDYATCLNAAKEKFIIVFDDFGPKFPSVQEAIKALDETNKFDETYFVPTDGWIFQNKYLDGSAGLATALTEHGMVVGMKGFSLGK